jgi:hypothetical protein
MKGGGESGDDTGGHIEGGTRDVTLFLGGSDDEGRGRICQRVVLFEAEHFEGWNCDVALVVGLGSLLLHLEIKPLG